MLPAFFHQTPFFRLLLPFITGIVIGFSVVIPLSFCLLACSFFMACFCILLWKLERRRGWLYGIFLYMFLFSAGICTVSLRVFTPVEQSEQGVWLVVVTEPPIERENSMRATVHIRANLTENTTFACDEQVMTYFRKDSMSRNIRQGDLLVMNAVLNPVTNAGNPHEFDYRGYLARKRISRSVFAESGNWCQLDSYAQGPLINFSNRLRNNLLDILIRGGLSGNELAVTSAMVLGYKADIDDELRYVYSASGAMHILAVSGLHVGIIYVVLSFVINLIPFLNRSKWLHALILLGILWLYALVTGMSPSVMRAATMFSFITVGEALYRKSHIYNSIAASAFLLLLIHPGNLFEVGFQFSYMAVIAIVFLNAHFSSLLTFNHRLPKYAWNLTCVSIAAQIGTAPLSLYYFHQFPSYFILSNFVVIPAATVIIYGALLLFVFSPVPVLLEIFGWMLDKFVYLCNFCIFFIEKLPGSVIFGIRFGGWEILCAYGFVATVGIWVLTARKTALFAMLVVLLLWIAGGGVRNNNDLQRQQLIVYNSQGNSLLQFVNGRDNTVLYTYRDPSFNASRFTENQRTAMHLKHTQYIRIDSVQHAKKSLPTELYVDGNFVQFADKRLAIFTRNMLPQSAGQSIPTDVVILTQNVNAGISQIVESYRPGVVVIDASNARTRADRWEKECEESDVNCHRVDTDGAFILTVE